MSLSTRLPVVEFQSLLLPPIRLRLQTLHSFARAQCTPVALHRARPTATWFTQRRSLHLYKTAKAKTALGMHKVLDYDHYEFEPPSASKHRVNLVKSEMDPEVIAKDLSLQELYDNYVSPGKFLYLADPIPKKLSENYELMRDSNFPAERNTYAIAEARTMEQVQMKNPQLDRKQLGELKNIILLLSNPVGFTKLALDRAYQFIEYGSPVEMRIRLFGSAVAVKNRGKAPDAGAWPWLHENFPHLRPDFIRKSMPEGTEFLISPVSDRRTIQFVLGRQAEQMAKLDLTTRLFRVKSAVQASLPSNPMAQRYMYKTQKRAGQKHQNGDEQPADEPDADEKARQKQVIAAAKSGRGGRLVLNEQGLPAGGIVSLDEAMKAVGLGLNKRVRQKQHGEGEAKTSKLRNKWEGRGSKKQR